MLSGRHFRYLIAMVLILSGLAELTSEKTVAATNVGAENAGTVVAPLIGIEKTIHIVNEKTSEISRLVFSPKGRYLAILVNNSAKRVVDIVIWDLQQDREQSRVQGLPIYAMPYLNHLLWSPDGRYITLGSGGATNPMLFWDPMTGKIEKQLNMNVGAVNSAYSPDGSKLLVNTTPLVSVHYKSDFRVYDTKTWDFKEYEGDGLMIQTLSWTADGKVLAAGEWPKASVGLSIDQLVPEMSDVLVRRIDPSGGQRPRTVILGHGTPDKDRPKIITSGPINTRTSTTDAKGNLVALGSGHITVLDTKTLAILFFYAPRADELQSGAMPDGALGDNIAFSPDGKYLYLAASSRTGSSLVLNAQTGTELARFQGAIRGIAVSPDGRTLAQGNGGSVDIFSIQ